ncbi:MAG: ATP-binding protein [Ornithinimicrobium sp.]
MPTLEPNRPLARIIVISGPSGSGKSRLASTLRATHGWPVVELDDFYRDGSDPLLPMSPLGLPDWDDAASWDKEAALRALLTLREEGTVVVPRYDISTSSVTGTRRVSVAGADVIVAEGIFAAHLIEPLAAHGIVVHAWCIRNRPWLTFITRFTRDVRQRRKPVITLWRRGHQLRRAEPGIVHAQHLMGATAMSSTQARQQAADLATALRPGTRQPHD